MGSCHSIPYFLQNNEYESVCNLCWESVSLKKNYIKCSNCSIFLHEICAKNIKNIYYCPNCKLKNSLIKLEC